MNTYISNFVIIFYFQDQKKLLLNLAIVMIFKQFFIVLAEYLFIKFRVHWKRSKIEKLFKEQRKNSDKANLLDHADLELHYFIER